MWWGLTHSSYNINNRTVELKCCHLVPGCIPASAIPTNPERPADTTWCFSRNILAWPYLQKRSRQSVQTDLITAHCLDLWIATLVRLRSNPMRSIMTDSPFPLPPPVTTLGVHRLGKQDGKLVISCLNLSLVAWAQFDRNMLQPYRNLVSCCNFIEHWLGHVWSIVWSFGYFQTERDALGKMHPRMLPGLESNT